MGVSACNTHDDTPNVGLIYVSADSGSTWHSFDAKAAFGSPLHYLWFGMSVDGATLLLIAGEDNNVTEFGAGWISRDHGVTWTAVSLPTAGSRAPERCAVSPDGQGMAIAYRNYQGGNFQDHYKMDWSSDSGSTWNTSSFAVQGTPGSANFEPAGVFMFPSNGSGPGPGPGPGGGGSTGPPRPIWTPQATYLREMTYRRRFLGQSFDPTLVITKDRPGPLRIVELDFWMN